MFEICFLLIHSKMSICVSALLVVTLMCVNVHAQYPGKFAPKND